MYFGLWPAKIRGLAEFRPKFSKRGPKIFFRKFHKKLFWIRTNTMLNTNHTKYEGLTPPELGEKF